MMVNACTLSTLEDLGIEISGSCAALGDSVRSQKWVGVIADCKCPGFSTAKEQR